MQNLSPTPTFRRGVVEPVACLKAGWALIRQHYWLFFGMTLVTMLLGSMVPFGLILGPLMCGLYLAFFRLRRGEMIEFGNIFKGFDYFGESVIATLIHYVPMVVIILPFNIVLYAGMFLMMPRQGSEPDPGSLFGFLAVLMLLLLVMMILIILISVIFTFSYPLIVDRKLSGIDAVKLSARAAMANFWPLLGLLLLNGLLNFAGLLLCIVGIYLTLPINFAAIAAAYEQVFGLGEVQAPNLPPPPPTFT